MDFLKQARKRLKLLRPFIIVALLAAVYFLPGDWENGFGPSPDAVLTREDAVSLEDARQFFPGAESLSVHDGLFRVKRGDGSLLGFVAAGPPEGVRIIGYAGEVPFIAGLDVDNRIKGVRLLASRETPDYARRVSDELGDAWTGLGPAEAYRQPVDAVTGATQTSMALIEGVRETMREISGERHDGLLYHPPAGFRFTASILVLLFFAAALSCYFLRYNSRRVRFSLRALSVIIPGVVAASLLSLAVFGSWLMGFVSWQRHWLLLVIALFAVGLPILTGRNFYCLVFCPYGSAQELVGKINKNKLKPGKNIYRIAGLFRILLILAAFFVAVSGSGVSLYLFEPFTAFRWTYAPLFSRILAVSFLLLAVWLPRPWCRICPTGGILDGLKRARGK